MEGIVNSKMFLKEIGWEGVDWTYLALDKEQWWTIVNQVLQLLVLYSAGNLIDWGTVSF